MVRREIARQLERGFREFGPEAERRIDRAGEFKFQLQMADAVFTEVEGEFAAARQFRADGLREFAGLDGFPPLPGGGIGFGTDQRDGGDPAMPEFGQQPVRFGGPAVNLFEVHGSFLCRIISGRRIYRSWRRRGCRPIRR